MSYLTREQYDQLIAAINPRRVGKDGKGFSHLESYDCRAHLNRIFGFARWSADLLDLAPVFETATDGEKPRWTVCYRATVRLTVCGLDGTILATYTEAACGDASNYPSRADANDMAIKTAESQAFKRCAVNLGDQFGLSLYAKGSTNAVVGRSLIVPGGAERSSEPVDKHAPEVVPESERVEPAPDLHVESEPAVQPEVVTAGDRVEHYRAELSKKIGRTEVAGLAAQVAREGLMSALTHDTDGNVLTLAALVDSALKRVSRRGAA